VPRYMMLRLLETFFRRWWLYLVPVVLLAGFGFMSVSGAAPKFQSTGTLNVETATVLSSLSDTQNDGSFGFDTPAQTTSKKINSLLGTDQFIGKVATAAGLDQAVESGALSFDKLRAAVGASDAGQTFVKVTATMANPKDAQNLATATINSFVQGVVDSQVAQSQAAESFFAGLLDSYQADVDTARQKLNDYLKANPAPVTGTRPDDQAAELARLDGDVTQAESRYNAALSKSEDARLSTEQTRADINQRLEIVDTPALPPAPLPQMKAAAFGFATFLIIGLILTSGAVVVGAMLDHSVRFPADVRERLGVRVLAVVPEGGRSSQQAKQPKKKAKKSEPPAKDREQRGTGRKAPASRAPAKKAAPARRPAATPARRPTAGGRPAGRTSRPDATRWAG
jgi:uncharacterized protein involved in exopolysaccharide biosynthesis